MDVVTHLDEAEAKYAASVEEMESWDAKIQALPEDATDEERKFHEDCFDVAKARVARWRETVERVKAIEGARKKLAPKREESDDDEPEAVSEQRKLRASISVGSEPKTYERGSPHSYFGDLIAAKVEQDPAAMKRLARHAQEMAVERRDLTTADPGAGTFIPPLYLGERWIDKERARRPFADAVSSMPLSPVGKQMDFPRTQTVPTVAAQATEGTAPSETDFDGETYSVPKRTIAGQNDFSIQAYEWSQPGMDEVVMRELVKAYNAELDRQLLQGSGASGEHTGVRSVSSINTITFSSGNGAALVGKLYDALSQISTNAPGYQGNAVVMHPRRAAWISSHRDTNTPLLQQGQLMLASGTQDRGFAGSIAGVGVLLDANIATNFGASTNEDEVYVVDLDEIILAEGPLRTRVLSEVLSGTLQVRLQVFAYSAFAGGRRPKVITKISGAGLATPTFPST